MVNIVMAAISIILVLSFSSISYAQSISIGVKASTLGAGVEAEGAFTKTIGIRIGANYFTYDYEGTKDDIKYNFDLTLESASALLDWHPFRGSFRLSGGIIYNGNSFDAKAKPAVSYEIGDTTYTAEEVGTLTGKITFKDTAPYLGLGWDTSFGKRNRFGFVFDLGAVYQGSPEVELSADGPIANNKTFQDDLAKEEENLQSALDEFKYYPVIAIGLNYRF
jgi:hypothetical protein